ncbi:hypothetical protein Bca101_075523 [Brassica carinata]
MASSYSEKPQEEEETFEDRIEDQPYVKPPPFDIRILTPDQRDELHRLQRMKENRDKTKRNLAQLIRIHLIRDRAEFEEREVTQYELDAACALNEVMYWAPPLQLEGIEISTLKLQLEEICLPCGENNISGLNSLVLMNECLDMICETKKLDELRIEKLVRDHIEVCFDKSYLCASFDLESEFFILDEPRPLLELPDLGDELDVDKLLLEIENPHAENYHENVNIVYYLIDGDRVDYFVKTSFEHVVDFVFPPNAFDSHDHLNLKEHFITHVISLVKLFEEKSFGRCSGKGKDSKEARKETQVLWRHAHSDISIVTCSSRYSHKRFEYRYATEDELEEMKQREFSGWMEWAPRIRQGWQNSSWKRVTSWCIRWMAKINPFE